MKYFYWTSAIIWAGIIYWSSSISNFSSVVTVSNKQDDLISMLAHIFLYVVLTVLLVKAFEYSGVNKLTAISHALFISIVFGGLDELHQHFTPGREVHLSDWALDIFGAWLGSKIVKIIK